MTVSVLLNNQGQSVVQNILRMCPEPGLQIDPRTGVITIFGAPSTLGGTLLTKLINNTCNVLIIGQLPDWKFKDRDGRERELWERQGIIVPQRPGVITPGGAILQLIYDVTECKGAGHYVYDAARNKIKSPLDALLYHELTHCLHYCEGTSKVPDFDAEELATVAETNPYRASIGLPARAGHGGGCGAAPDVPGGSTGGSLPRVSYSCFIATAAYGSELEPEVEFLRRFRDDILRKTRSGEQFFDKYWEHYYRISPLIVEFMQQNPEVKDLVRWSLVSPIVRYLQLAVRFPDASLEGVEEPWRSFLLEMREGLQDWASPIDLPLDFRGLSAQDSAEEIALVMRYKLRTGSERAAYLLRLEGLGQLPLQPGAEEREDISERLLYSGRSEVEIKRILGTEVVFSPIEKIAGKAGKGHSSS